MTDESHVYQLRTPELHKQRCQHLLQPTPPTHAPAQIRSKQAHATFFLIIRPLRSPTQTTRIVPQGSSLEHLSRGTLGSSSYVGEHEDRIGHQGRGLLAGSRIKWPRYGDLNSVPVYYNDVETARNSYLKGSHNVSEVKGNMSEVGGWVEHGDVGMEYLGCFRDHPGHLREFNGAGGRHEGGEEATMKDREHLEEENTVYVFPRSLTPKVSTRVVVKYIRYICTFF